MAKISISIPDELKTQLDDYAEGIGSKRSTVITEMLEQFLPIVKLHPANLELSDATSLRSKTSWRHFTMIIPGPSQDRLGSRPRELGFGVTRLYETFRSDPSSPYDPYPQLLIRLNQMKDLAEGTSWPLEYSND